jgi:hypothetical protein
MKTISQAFKTQTTRPLDNLNAVSIAELAQFTQVRLDANQTPVSSAYDDLRQEWKFEIDESSPLYFVDWREACAVFADGSTLTFSTR